MAELKDLAKDLPGVDRIGVEIDEVVLHARRDQHRQHDEGHGQAQRDGQKQQDRQIVGGDGRHWLLPGLPAL